MEAYCSASSEEALRIVSQLANAPALPCAKRLCHTLSYEAAQRDRHKGGRTHRRCPALTFGRLTPSKYRDIPISKNRDIPISGAPHGQRRALVHRTEPLQLHGAPRAVTAHVAVLRVHALAC